MWKLLKALHKSFDPVGMVLAGGDELVEQGLHAYYWLKSKLWRAFAVLTLIGLCFYMGYDRWQLQKQILRLERQVDGIMLAKDMQEYRKAHPFKEKK